MSSRRANCPSLDDQPRVQFSAVVEPLDDFDVDYVLIESSNSLATLLTVSDQWRRVYDDDVATIYLRAR